MYRPDDALTPAAASTLPVESVDIDTLHADPANARRHPERNLMAIRDSLREFGQVEPLVVQKSTGKVIGGNGRLLVMREMGWQTVQAVRVETNAIQSAALAIALNRTGDLAEWDLQVLEMQLKSLTAENFNIGTLHFDDLSLHDAGEGNPLAPPTRNHGEENEPIDNSAWEDTKDPEIPQTPPVAISQPGDVWLLGSHKLLCGSSTNANHVANILGSEKISLIATDPPYGMRYKGGLKERDEILSDSPDVARSTLHDSMTIAKRHCSDSSVWYICAPGGLHFGMFSDVLRELNMWKQTLVWVKNTITFGYQDYRTKHELIVYGYMSSSHKKPPARGQTTVWEFDRPQSSPDHPTTKPVTIMARMCITSADEGSVVYEPFSGSGTTLLACEQTGRLFRGIELHPPYVDVAVRRWEEFTGRKAERVPEHR